MSPPKTLTADQCQALIEELMISSGTRKQLNRGFRNGSMAIVMLETGIRVGELCRLRLDDLWYGEQPVDQLVVRAQIAKNKQERQIPISRKLSETIKVMHETIWVTSSDAANRYAFFTNVEYTPLTTRTVERIILDAGQAALHQVVTPHMLRHTFASRMMRKTNARVVQALLGHTSLQSTQIYMHPNSEDLFEAINS